MFFVSLTADASCNPEERSQAASSAVASPGSSTEEDSAWPKWAAEASSVRLTASHTAKQEHPEWPAEQAERWDKTHTRKPETDLKYDSSW